MTGLAGGPLFGLPLTELWFALLFFVLALFLFLDGLDFGAGVLFAFRSKKAERRTLIAAIGPVWEGNAVWLVVFGGVLFAAFPPVYANLFSRYYLLMFAILATLGLRGLAIKLYKERDDERWQRWWGRAFVVGSALAPFCLGMFVGNWVVGATGTLTLAGAVVGLAVVALSVLDGVAFLRLKTRGDLREDLRQYGIWSAVAYLVLAVASLAVLYVSAPRLQSAILSPPVLALVGLTVILGGGYIVALWQARHQLALAAAGGLVFTLTGIVAVLLFPAIDPAVGLTVREAIVSTLPLNLMSIMAAILVPIILVYFGVLYSVFSGPIEAGETY